VRLDHLLSKELPRMGGQACGVLSWVSFLLFPHPFVCCGGVAGWNMTPEDVNGFGTLLGPEETSAGWWGFSWWPLPALTV
jgi:hypothetical protein